MGRQADEMDSVKDHPAPVWLIEAAHQVEQRRFAGPVRADDGKHAAMRNVE
jgi:hypothetical protein